MVIKSAVLQGRLLDADTVVQMADLPSKEVLLSRLLGAMQAPLSNLASVLQAPMGQLARALDALRTQKEKTEPPASAPAPAA
jgi:large subunit ribosomal protein L10